jgi:formiminotetrahydrofolate cyclodeaminase
MEIKQFLEKLAADTPTPGGGSASALAGALSASLLSMVAGLSLEKGSLTKKKANEIRKESLRIQKELFLAIHQDAKSYEAVLKAFRLPKNTEKERSYRSQMIQGAYQGATVIPQRVCELSLQLLKDSEDLILKGNPNAISDVGVAAFLANAAFDGGLLNININLGSIRDKRFLRKMGTLKKRYVKGKNHLMRRIGKALIKHRFI